MDNIPILQLYNGETVEALFHDLTHNAVLIGTSSGRIIRMTSLASTAYLTGERSVFAQFSDGFGFVPPTKWSNVFYALQNMVVELTEDKVPTNWKEVTKSFSATKIDEVSGIFTSPIMWAGEDLGWWNNITWTQESKSSGDIKVAVRVSDSTSTIITVPWMTLPSANGSSTVTRSLDYFNPKGSYIQMRVILVSKIRDSTPKMTDMTVSSETKHAVYFFTTKFKMSKETQLDSGMVTGHMSVPKWTEVKFGVSGTNSADWNDYTVITPDKLFAFPSEFTSRFKVGIKFISYSNTAFPVVDEFAIALGADADNLINKEP